MNTYFGFGFDYDAASGGIDDCEIITTDFEKAKQWLESCRSRWDYYYIYDFNNNNKIYIQDIVD